jgi:diguanylate cyclase (GGDEF)-like protein
MNHFISTLYASLDFNRGTKRYDSWERHAISTLFLLSGVYCLVAIIFLLSYGVQAVMAGNASYALMLFAFSIVTAFGYFLIWHLGLYTWGGHLVVLLMGTLCLVLFYTGGQQNTGPMWYLVFPILATFAQGRLAGVISIAILLFLTLLLATVQIPGLEPAQYNVVFLQRLFSVYVVISALAYLFAFFRYQAEIQLTYINKQLEILTNTDKLSGLLNRRGMDAKLENMQQTYTRFKLPFTLVIFDIDKFKSINDEHGHMFGDFVIQQIGEICRTTLRKIDDACRWGGEEFLLLLPGTSEEGAFVLAERLRDRISEKAFALDGKSARVTASFGICQYSEPGGLDKTLHVTDSNMYLAKQKGGNLVVSGHDLPDS